MAREMTRNNPLVMHGAGRLVANVVGRGRMNPLNRRKQRERSGVFLPLLSPLPPVQSSSDLQFANLVAAKIQSWYTILREMDAAKAEELNARLGLDLTWRDILTWPMPEGVQVSVQQRGTPSNKNRSRPASKPAAANEPNRDSEANDDN